VEIDFLSPEFERRSTSFEVDNPHAQDLLVKVARCLHVLHGQNDMVDGINLEGVSRRLFHARPNVRSQQKHRNGKVNSLICVLPR